MGFTDNPIINSPFEVPAYSYELDAEGQPTGVKLPGRRESIQVVPVPAARRRGPKQAELDLFDEAQTKITSNALINEIRKHVGQWRALPSSQWGVTPETQRLLLHWREPSRARRLFFCQREAVETLIYLTEVAPQRFRKQIEDANNEANPGLYRLACKMATGSGKTTVMGMIIAWHAVNKARRSGSKTFSDAFLIIAPGITIRDRLSVLNPSHPENDPREAGGGGWVMGEWRTQPLSDFVDPERSICYGIVQPGSPVANGVPIVRVNNFIGGGVDASDALKVDAQIETKYRRSRLQGGELLITLVGSMGLTAIASEELRGWNVARAVGVVPLRANADKRWINFVVRSKPAQDFIRMRANTTVQATFNLKDLAELPIPCPPDAARIEMSAILSSLDDKIELNRRMNETLEAMARAIFKDWFVDFGPTRAKMEGRAPYLAPDIWSLFPNRLDDEGKPQGWSVKPLDQIADFLNGLALQKYPANGGDSLPVIKIAQLRAASAASADLASSEIPRDYVVENGDVLFSWSGSLLQRVWTAGRGALNQHLFKVTSKQFPKWFFFHWITEHMPSFQATAASKATTMGHIQRHHLTQAVTVIGTPAVMKAADEAIAPIFDRQIANDLESRTLAATRDFLLPKLMSGEVRVKEAEKLIGGAT